MTARLTEEQERWLAQMLACIRDQDDIYDDADGDLCVRGWGRVDADMFRAMLTAVADRDARVGELERELDARPSGLLSCVMRMITAHVTGDEKKWQDYGEFLCQQIEQEGQPESAMRFRRALAGDIGNNIYPQRQP
jgi:hypothetical protein